MKEKIKHAFESPLGQQCNTLFSTSDERIFIRFNEASEHTKGQLDIDTQPLKNRDIIEWYDENTSTKFTWTGEYYDPQR